MKHLDIVTEVKQLSNFLENSKNGLMMYGEKYTDNDFYMHLEPMGNRINFILNRIPNKSDADIKDIEKNKIALLKLTQSVYELINELDKLNHLFPKEPCLVWDRIQVCRSHVKYIERCNFI